MATVLSQKFLIAKKEHNCDACFVLSECISDVFSELTFKEKKAVVRMKNQKMKIMTGQKYIKQANIFNGDFCVFKADIEIDAICVRLDLYEEY